MNRFDKFVLTCMITLVTWCPGLARDFIEYIERGPERC